MRRSCDICMLKTSRCTNSVQRRGIEELITLERRVEYGFIPRTQELTQVSIITHSACSEKTGGYCSCTMAYDSLVNYFLSCAFSRVLRATSITMHTSDQHISVNEDRGNSP